MMEASNLSKSYGNFTALNGLNLTVKEGEIFCLLGANGSVKPTTINLFLNFVEPRGGRASINSLDVPEHARETKQQLSYIPESLILYPNLTGLENLNFFCGLAGKNYSKGMRQKVGIAISRARKAGVLLLDEPTSGLDPKSSKEFSELLLDMKEKGVAALMATHDLFRAKDTGTHIGIMKEGILIEQFACDEVSFQHLEKVYLKHMYN